MCDAKVFDPELIRSLLIETCYSNEEATSFFDQRLNDQNLLDLLVKIALDEDDRGGDAPMAAGDFIYKFPSERLKEYETQFISILKREYSSARSEDIAMALAKFKSVEAKDFIEKEIRELEYGSRCEKFRIALRMYDFA